MRKRYEEGQDYARFTLQEEGLSQIKRDLKDMVREDLMSHFDLGYYDECVKIVAVEEAVAEAQKEVLEAIVKLAEDYKEEQWNNYEDSKAVYGEEGYFVDTDMGKWLGMTGFCQELNKLMEDLINEK